MGDRNDIRLPPMSGPKQPKLKAIIYCEFDNEKGPVMKFQIPENTISQKEFSLISSAVMPSAESRDRIVRLNIFDIKLIGFPVAIRNEKYLREFYIFNVCFVFDKSVSGENAAFEAIIQKFSEYLINLEREESFLTKRLDELPEVMEKVFKDLNTTGNRLKLGSNSAFLGECVFSISKETTFYFRLTPSFHGIEPQPLNQFMVPVFIRQPAPVTPEELAKMDVLSQKVCPQINGISCIRDIAGKIQIDVGLVGRCLRYLHSSGCITFLPLFLYSNQYIPNKGVRALLVHESVRQKCVDYVRLSSERPAPSYTDVFRLYVSMGPGRTLLDWCKECRPRENYNIDERRFIQFGVYYEFIKVAKVFAHIEEHVPNIDGSVKFNKKATRRIVKSQCTNNTGEHLGQDKPAYEEEIILEEERPVHELAVQLSISPFNIVKRLEGQQKSDIIYR